MKKSRIIVVISFLIIFSGCAHLKKTDLNAKATPYPLSTCIVTDNDLGSMGDPITRVYNGQEIKFCCSPCVKEFEADPKKYLSKLDKN